MIRLAEASAPQTMAVEAKNDLMRSNGLAALHALPTSMQSNRVEVLVALANLGQVIIASCLC